MTTSANAPAITEKTIRDVSKRQNEPAWLLERRLDAWRAYEAMSMPNPLEEEWRRTDISALDLEAALDRAVRVLPSEARVQQIRELSQSHAIGAELPADVPPKTDGAIRLIELDGGTAQIPLFKKASGGAPIFADLSSAAKRYRKLIEPYLGSLVRPSDWKLQAFQAALRSGGAFIHVPRGLEVEVPLHYVISTALRDACPHLLIVAEAGSSVTVIQETFSKDTEEQALISGAVEIFAKQDARVRFVELQRWGKNTYNFSTIRARLDQGAELTAGLVGLGSRLTKTKLEVSLEGEGSRAELLGLSFGDGKQHFDYGTLQDHIAPRTTSDLLFKAALAGEASEVWYGTVRIQKGASASDANQTSRNLLLSDKAKAAPIPVLEIEAYDILRCSHGAAAGPLDEEQLFYLESRGIPPAGAQRMLVDAFFQQVIDRMPGEAIRERVEQALTAKIEAGA